LEQRVTVNWSGGVTFVHRTLYHDFKHNLCQLLHSGERLIDPFNQFSLVPIYTIQEYTHLAQNAYNEPITNDLISVFQNESPQVRTGRSGIRMKKVTSNKRNGHSQTAYKEWFPKLRRGIRHSEIVRML
jgi:hypothetical protein